MIIVCNAINYYTIKLIDIYKQRVIIIIILPEWLMQRIAKVKAYLIDPFAWPLTPVFPFSVYLLSSSTFLL